MFFACCFFFIFFKSYWAINELIWQMEQSEALEAFQKKLFY